MITKIFLLSFLFCEIFRCEDVFLENFTFFLLTLKLLKPVSELLEDPVGMRYSI